MTNQTAAMTVQYVNNGSMATAQTKVVPLVVVNNSLVPDFRQANPGVVLAGVGANTDGTQPLQASAQYS